MTDPIRVELRSPEEMVSQSPAQHLVGKRLDHIFLGYSEGSAPQLAISFSFVGIGELLTIAITTEHARMLGEALRKVTD